ncbi:Chemotaxis response regulator protein-glutamate methylesterase [Pigmentiphaga humi]|uniref:protein-glutamate methylesterase n=1 Tax=Pigmentiphaga humi TaxID=2478468 RepID=A0A3P4B1F7_9BURK|nr:Chemotaxis response regulator protein-glutamate methylesterase [Pigmentiphaga humi]
MIDHVLRAADGGTPRPSRYDRRLLVAIGASTGGTEALRELLEGLPADMPPIVITQHMPPGFTRSFAERLDKHARLHVKEAEHGERLLAGCVYIAPGHAHLVVKALPLAGYYAQLSEDEPVNRHRPSVEVLFLSVAKAAGAAAVAVMLTGMGKDGARAMLTLRESGACNLAQDEASSVVFGMPREAIALGAVHDVVPLPQMAQRLLAAVEMRQKVLPLSTR